ncbi:MAG: hypothetical protein GJ671_09475 [Alteromonadaceae bacterium]|nr:hypothetical protein [Alteromonadaceae bacterium]
MIEIPSRDYSKRAREYLLRDNEQIAEIVKTYLFDNSTSHRKLDEMFLGLDASESRGYQSMGVLHYLGLKGEFKGLFAETSLNEATEILQNASEDFSDIIELISNAEENEKKVVSELLDKTKQTSKTVNIEQLARRLEELENTETKQRKSSGRKEQAILRSLVIGDKDELQCALCHKLMPTNLIVTAHIVPRNKCSLKQRKDPHIVMPACKVGCDSFFEDGYLEVHNDGSICVSETLKLSDDLKKSLDSYSGKECLAFNENTESYFAQKLSIVKT